MSSTIDDGFNDGIRVGVISESKLDDTREEAVDTLDVSGNGGEDIHSTTSSIPPSPVSSNGIQSSSSDIDSDSSSDCDSDSDPDTRDQFDDESDDEPLIILDEDAPAPPVATRFTVSQSSTQIHQQSVLATREALTNLGAQRFQHLQKNQKLDRFLERLKSDISAHSCYLALSTEREDLDLTSDLENPDYQKVFESFRIAKTNLSLRKYVIQQSLYQLLLEKKIGILADKLEVANKDLKDNQESESQWVEQLDQADVNLTRVTNYWEIRYRNLEMLSRSYQKRVWIIVAMWISSLGVLQYLNSYGFSPLWHIFVTCLKFVASTTQISVSYLYYYPLLLPVLILLFAAGYLYHRVQCLSSSKNAKDDHKKTR